MTASILSLRWLAFLVPVMMSSPAAAELITVCTGPAAQLESAATSSSMARLLASVDKENLTGPSRRLALTRDAAGQFDLIADWHGAGAVSLRGPGATISGLELGGELFHLILSRADQPTEHFLFSLDEAGTGELLWSSDGAAPSHIACLRPE